MWTMPSAWRYRYVYAKLRDFEDYLTFLWGGHHPPHRRRPRPPGPKMLPC